MSSNEEVQMIKHDDDLRNGSLTYTIIDETTFSTKNDSKPHTQTLTNLSYLTLPRLNEIKCFDDLKNQFEMSNSYICWRYARRRALLNLKIQPLPFVGFEANTIPKCYLEYFNECTKRFVVFKEFCIEEGVSLSVVEPPRPSDVLVYSKCWRIRLSKEAKKFIYASCLVASTQVDSVEISGDESTPLGRSKCFYSHIELNLSSVEVKINTIGFKLEHSDLLTLTLSQFSVRSLLNQVKKSETIQRSSLNLYALGQLQIDFCEYRFLTMRPILDAFQFKTALDYKISNNALTICAEIDNLNFLASQSALICFRQLENEWLSEKIEGLGELVIECS
jgi:hypothetical protein